MSINVDIAIVGAGAMGAATAWQLSQRGVSVEVFEQFEPGHVHGASHGASRNFNVAYDEPRDLAWLREARRLWRELERESATALFEVTGIVNHGGGRDLASVTLAVRAGGFAAELLDAREARRRWPGIRFDGPVLHTPEAGRLNADTAVNTLLARTVAMGGRVHWRTRVEDLVVHDDNRVHFRAVDDSGEHVVRARRVVTTAGAWTSRVLNTTDAGSALPPLRVTQEQPAHFAPLNTSTAWPGFNHLPAPGVEGTAWFPAGIYGMYTPGRGVKVGWHAAGPEIDPNRRSYTPDPELRAALIRYAREWLPGVNPDDFHETTCTYTSTPDSRFVLERVGPLVIGAGFSGHGFKFTPVVGRILADATVR